MNKTALQALLKPVQNESSAYCAGQNAALQNRYKELDNDSVSRVAQCLGETLKYSFFDGYDNACDWYANVKSTMADIFELSVAEFSFAGRTHSSAFETNISNQEAYKQLSMTAPTAHERIRGILYGNRYYFVGQFLIKHVHHKGGNKCFQTLEKTPITTIASKMHQAVEAAINKILLT